MGKHFLREEMRRRKRTTDVDNLRAQAQVINERLLAHPIVAEADVILLYASLPDEVDTCELIRELSARGKKVLLPVVIDDEHMELRVYLGEHYLQEGAFHIKEPVGDVFTDYDTIGVAIVPGMAFDKCGNRLGRGKGYYDRFLASIPYIYIIGVCYDFQLLDEIPTEAHDRRVNEVVSFRKSECLR